MRAYNFCSLVEKQPKTNSFASWCIFLWINLYFVIPTNFEIFFFVRHLVDKFISHKGAMKRVKKLSNLSLNSIIFLILLIVSSTGQKEVSHFSKRTAVRWHFVRHWWNFVVRNADWKILFYKEIFDCPQLESVQIIFSTIFVDKF